MRFEEFKRLSDGEQKAECLKSLGLKSEEEAEEQGLTWFPRRRVGLRTYQGGFKMTKTKESGPQPDVVYMSRLETQGARVYYGQRKLADCHDGSDFPAEREAYAKLFAASPRLYKVVKTVMERYDSQLVIPCEEVLTGKLLTEMREALRGIPDGVVR